MTLVSAAWGAWDGRRRGAAAALTTWALAAVAYPPLAIVCRALLSSGTDWGLVRDDPASRTPFLAGLAFVPAAAAVGLARLSRRPGHGSR